MASYRSPHSWVLNSKHYLLQAITLAFVLCSVVPGNSAVLINEFVAAASDRRLSWTDDGLPRLGSGAGWNEPGFDSAAWAPLLLPAGYGFSGLSVNLSSQMKDKAPSIYLRKEFIVTAEQAASSNSLVLVVQVNDGFVAFLNGRELARANCGASNSFMFASQPAYNVNSSTNVVQYTNGPACSWLVDGTNILAVQAHNAEQPSTQSSPDQINWHVMTPEFFINAGLQLVGDTNTPGVVDLVPLGKPAGNWRYVVGRVEPSGGVADMGLVTKPFSPPHGQEDDYDQPNEFADYVELYNTAAEAVDLSGWSLTDDPLDSAKWRFPTNTSLAAGGFLLVLCDQRDEANAPAGPATRLHTNFKLDDSSGYLALVNKYGQLADALPSGYPPQVSWCSYGRNPENPALWGFLGCATPGKPNAGPFYSTCVKAPDFLAPSGTSLPGGIYRTQSVWLCLSSKTPGSSVRYTLNGSEPTASNGVVYTAPIFLSQPNEKIAVVVRARAFASGLLPSEVKTHSYILRQPAGLTNSPALLMTANAGRSFYSPEGALAIVGGRFISTSSGDIWQANGPQSYNNVLGAGQPFERETHVEFYFPPGYYPTNQEPMSADVGLRMSASGYSCPRMKLTGVNSSPWPPFDFTQKPSFNLYFSGDYGAGELHYPLFTNYPVKDFQHLRLRAGKNDMSNPFITDELVRRLWLAMGHVGARGIFSSLYLNGLYKGVFNVTERFREQFFQRHYNSDAQWDVCYTYDWVDGDNVAYQQLLSSLDLNLTNLGYWRSITNKLDVDNAADYFLLNVYCAMWDWPQNNFIIARERSTGPDSRFRFAVWDAEGAFNAIGYGKAVSYNTLTTDLIVPPGNPNYMVDLPRIFRRLASAPEFRLRFADRINLLMFNGGVLDDRDPDGYGPLCSRFAQLQNDLFLEAGDLVKYNSGQVLVRSAFTSWASPVGGRRGYLLGTTTGRQMFRDAGLWPVTEPPIFNQHGGAVPPGFDLTMTSSVAVTGQTSTIYFTLDGTDPRLMGGILNTSASVYTGPVIVDNVVAVKARARNDATMEWSPLTEATFAPAAVAASADNLVSAELMYHPPLPTASELAAGFSDADDFEFIRLLNISSTPVDLAGARFVLGISFDFSAGAFRYLCPGASVVVVKDRNAFRARYGTVCESFIVGEFGGNLANSGERVQLRDSNDTVIFDFTYGDAAPWPGAADGEGPSLLLRDPASKSNPVDPLNWVVCTIPGGLPAGVPPSQTYAGWRALYWGPGTATNDAISGPEADPDGDGISNFFEYAFGLDPRRANATPHLDVAPDPLHGGAYLCIGLRCAPGAQEARLLWETSEDLQHWSAETDFLQLDETENCGDGTAVLRYLAPIQPDGQQNLFIRLKVTSPW